MLDWWAGCMLDWWAGCMLDWWAGCMLGPGEASSCAFGSTGSAGPSKLGPRSSDGTGGGRGLLEPPLAATEPVLPIAPTPDDVPWACWWCEWVCMAEAACGWRADESASIRLGDLGVLEAAAITCLMTAC